MSKYREIKTEYRSIESLRKALADLGVPFDEAPDVKSPSLPMLGYLGDERPERVSLAIRKGWIDNNWSCERVKSMNPNIPDHVNPGWSNDIGFRWDGLQLAALVSEYDQSRPGVMEALKTLRRRYAFHEAMRLSRAHGYNVKSTATEDGKIRITIARR